MSFSCAMMICDPLWHTSYIQFGPGIYILNGHFPNGLCV